MSAALPRAGTDGVLEIDAPSREAAEALVARLERCQCVVVERARDEWCVRASPLRQDGRSLQVALSTVEAWTVELGARTTKVALGERTFTLAAEVSV